MCSLYFKSFLRVHVLSNSNDLSNTYWLYGQCTRHINFRQVFGDVGKMYGVFYSSKSSLQLIQTVIAQWSKAQVK